MFIEKTVNINLEILKIFLILVGFMFENLKNILRSLFKHKTNGYQTFTYSLTVVRMSMWCHINLTYSYLPKQVYI